MEETDSIGIKRTDYQYVFTSFSDMIDMPILYYLHEMMSVKEERKPGNQIQKMFFN